MVIGTAISLVLSILAILISLRAFYYTKRQTDIMEGQESRRQREEKSLAEWVLKFDRAIRALQNVGYQKFSPLASTRPTDGYRRWD
jgi:hypothetical protein